MIKITYNFYCDNRKASCWYHPVEVKGYSLTEARARWRLGGGIITLDKQTFCCVKCYETATGLKYPKRLIRKRLGKH